MSSQQPHDLLDRTGKSDQKGEFLVRIVRWTVRERLRKHGVNLRLRLADDADAQREIQAASELTFDDVDGRTADSE